MEVSKRSESFVCSSAPSLFPPQPAPSTTRSGTCEAGLRYQFRNIKNGRNFVFFTPLHFSHTSLSSHSFTFFHVLSRHLPLSPFLQNATLDHLFHPSLFSRSLARPLSLFQHASRKPTRSKVNPVGTLLYPPFIAHITTSLSSDRRCQSH